MPYNKHMKLIVGLGNPGLKYEKTRHNLGFIVLSSFLRKMEPVKETKWNDNEKFKAETAEVEYKEEKIILVSPKTFMNNSGMAVKAISQYYKIPPEDIWVIHDDVDISIGNMKIRFGGASAGHRGVDSIINTLGTDKFWRFRMGIGRQLQGALKQKQPKKIDSYVLGKFKKGDMGNIRELEKKGVEAIIMSLDKGLEAAMNKFNIK